MVEKVRKSKKEWRNQLTPEQYRVAGERETEKRFSHLEHNAKDGCRENQCLLYRFESRFLVTAAPVRKITTHE